MKKPKRLAELLSKGAYFIEVMISVVLLCAVILLLIRTVMQSGIFRLNGQDVDFDTFLLSLFNLVIGVEFTRMLCKHTPETVVEVLLFALARQIVVSHPSIEENIIGVIAIAMLFAIRKFLIPPASSKPTCAKSRWTKLKPPRTHQADAIHRTSADAEQPTQSP